MFEECSNGDTDLNVEYDSDTQSYRLGQVRSVPSPTVGLIHQRPLGCVACWVNTNWVY